MQLNKYGPETVDIIFVKMEEISNEVQVARDGQRGERTEIIES